MRLAWRAISWSYWEEVNVTRIIGVNRSIMWFVVVSVAGRSCEGIARLFFRSSLIGLSFGITWTILLSVLRCRIEGEVQQMRKLQRSFVRLFARESLVTVSISGARIVWHVIGEGM